MTETGLSVQDVTVAYHSMVAVEGVSMHVAQGDIVALLGANGAGKSTLLRALAGSLPPRSGSIRFRGRETSRLPPHRVARAGILLCPQEREVFTTMTVAENLDVGAHVHRRRSRWVRDKKRECLVLFPPLVRLLDRPAGGLSGGEQQMLAMARSLMGDPKALLLDEPSAGLAPLIVDTIFDAIRTLAASGLTIVLAEQNAREALSVASHVHILASGQIVSAGPVEDYSRDDEILASYFGPAPALDAVGH